MLIVQLYEIVWFSWRWDKRQTHLEGEGFIVAPKAVLHGCEAGAGRHGLAMVLTWL